ncbi:CBS domain-containing protein [Sciscionella marina]|uniref:CBS domain-containing protein n=1 Tax=Sciscionella marina TaxID=508770 RepID=UPI000367BA09|nr:CBS domain-containing protein [Sciscionella marina]
MYISDVLQRKGSNVASVESRSTVRELLAELAERNIGAVVVLTDQQPSGVVSERDIVRHLHAGGERVLDWPVSQIMATPIVTCTSKDTVDSVMVTMTERRVRHIPVIDDEQLAGIVSIGDVVKHMIAKLETDREQLETYIVKG